MSTNKPVRYKTKQYALRRVAISNSHKLKKMMLGSNSSSQYFQMVDRLCTDFMQQDSFSAQHCSGYRNDGNNFNPSYYNSSYETGGNHQNYYQNYVSSFDSQSYCQQTSSWANGHYNENPEFGNSGFIAESYTEDRRVFCESPQRGDYTRTVEYSSNVRSAPDRPGPYRGDVDRPTRWRRDSGDCRMNLEEQTSNFIRNNKRVISSREEREYSHDIRYNEKHIKKMVKKVIKKHVREEIPKIKRGEPEKSGRYSKMSEEKGSRNVCKNNNTKDVNGNKVDTCDRSLNKLDSCKTNEKRSPNSNNVPVKSDNSKISQTSSVSKKSSQTSKDVVPGSHFKSIIEKEDSSSVVESCSKNGENNKSTNASNENEARDKINDSAEMNDCSKSESSLKISNNNDSAKEVAQCEQAGLNKPENAPLLGNMNDENNIRGETVELNITDNLLNLPPHESHSNTMDIEKCKTEDVKTDSINRENDIQKDVESSDVIWNENKEHVENEDSVERIGNDSIHENESFVVIDEITEADDEVESVTEVERRLEMEGKGKTNENIETHQELLLDVTMKTAEPIVQDVINAMIDTICTNSEETRAVDETNNINRDISCDKSTSESHTTVADGAKTLHATRKETQNSTTLKESHNSVSSCKVTEQSRSHGKERHPTEDITTFEKHSETELDHADKFANTFGDENNNKNSIQEHCSPGKSKKHKKKKALFEARSIYRVRKHYNPQEDRTLDRELGMDELMEKYNHHKRMQSPYLNTNQEYDLYGQQWQHSRSSFRESSGYQKYSYRNSTSHGQNWKYGNNTYQAKVERRHVNRTECKRQDYERYNLCPQNIDSENINSIPAKRNKLAETSVANISRNSDVDMNSSHECSFSSQNCLLLSVPSSQTGDSCREVALYDGPSHCKCPSNSDETFPNHMGPKQCSYCIAMIHYQHFQQLQLSQLNTAPMAISEKEHDSGQRSRKSSAERNTSSRKSSEERTSSRKSSAERNTSSRKSSEERNSSSQKSSAEKKSYSRKSSEERKSKKKNSKSSSSEDNKVLLETLTYAVVQTWMEWRGKKGNLLKRLKKNNHKNKLKIRGLKASRRNTRKLLSKTLKRSNQQEPSDNLILNQSDTNFDKSVNDVLSNNGAILEVSKSLEPEITQSQSSNSNLPGILSFNEFHEEKMKESDTSVKDQLRAQEESPIQSVSTNSCTVENSLKSSIQQDPASTSDSSTSTQSDANFDKPVNRVLSSNEAILEVGKALERETTQSQNSNSNLPGILSFHEVQEKMLKGSDTSVKNQSRPQEGESPIQSVSTNSCTLEKLNADKNTVEKRPTIEKSKTDNHRKEYTGVDSVVTNESHPIVNETKDKKIVSDRKKLRISIDLGSIGSNLHSIIQTKERKLSAKSSHKNQTSPNQDKLRSPKISQIENNPTLTTTKESIEKAENEKTSSKIKDSPVEKDMERKSPILPGNSSKTIAFSTGTPNIAPNENLARFKIKNPILDEKFKESFKKNRISNVTEVPFHVNYKIPKIKYHSTQCFKSEDGLKSQLFSKVPQIASKSILKRRVSEELETVETPTTKDQFPPRRHSTCSNLDQQKDTALPKDVSPLSIHDILRHIPMSETSKTKKGSRHVSFSNIIDVINPDEKAKVMKNVAIEKKADSDVRTAGSADFSNRIEELNKDEIISNKCKWGLHNFFKLGQNSDKPKVTITASKITKGQKRVSRMYSVPNNSPPTSECPRSKSNLTLEQYLQQKQSKAVALATKHVDANQKTNKSTIETNCPQSKDKFKYSSIKDYIAKQNPRQKSVGTAPHVNKVNPHGHSSTHHRSKHNMKHKNQQQHGPTGIKTRPVDNSKPRPVDPSLIASSENHQKEKMVVAPPDKISLVENTLLEKQFSKDNPCQNVSGKTSTDELTDISLPKGISLTVIPQGQDKTHIRSVSKPNNPANSFVQQKTNECVGQEKNNVNSVISSSNCTKSGTREKTPLNSVTISTIAKSVTLNSVNSSNNFVKSTSRDNTESSFKSVSQSAIRSSPGIIANGVAKSIDQERRLSNSVIGPIKERRSSNSQLVVVRGETKIITTTKIQVPMKSKLDDKETKLIPNKKPKLDHITDKLPVQSSEHSNHARSHDVKTKPRPHFPIEKKHLKKTELHTKGDKDSKCTKREKSYMKPLGFNSRKDTEKTMPEVSKNISIENTTIERPVSPKKEQENYLETSPPAETPAMPNISELDAPIPDTNNANGQTTVCNEQFLETNKANNTDDHTSVDISGQLEACNKSPGDLEKRVPEISSVNLVRPKEEHDDSSESAVSEPKGNAVEKSMSGETPVESHTLSKISPEMSTASVKLNQSLPISEIEPINQAVLTKAQLEYEKQRQEELANCPTLRSVLSPSRQESALFPLSLRILTPEEIAKKFFNETDSLGAVPLNEQMNPCQIVNNQPTSEIISPDGHFRPSAIDSPRIAKSSFGISNNGAHPNQTLANPSVISPILPKPFGADKHPAYQGMLAGPPAILGVPGHGANFSHTLNAPNNLPFNHANPVNSSEIHNMLREPSVSTLAAADGRPILQKPFNIGTLPALDTLSQVSVIVGRNTETSVQSKPASIVNTKPTSSNGKPKKTTQRRKSKLDSVIDSVINGQSKVQLPYSSNPVQGTNHWNLESRQTRSSSADEYISLEHWQGLNQQITNFNPRNYLQSYAEFLKSRSDDNCHRRQNYTYYHHPNTGDSILKNAQLNQQNEPSHLNEGFSPNSQICNQNVAPSSAQRNLYVAPVQHNHQQQSLPTANNPIITCYPPDYQNGQNGPLVTHSKNSNVGVPQPRSLPSQVEASCQNHSVRNVQFVRHPQSQGISNMPTTQYASQNKSSASNNTSTYTNRPIGGPVQNNSQQSQLSSVRYSEMNPTLPSHPYFPYQNQLGQPTLNGIPQLNQLGMYNGHPMPIQNTNNCNPLLGTYQTYNLLGSHHNSSNIAGYSNQVPVYNNGSFENTNARMVDSNRRLSNTQLNLSQNNSNEMLSNSNTTSLPHSHVGPSSVPQNNPQGNLTQEVLSSYHMTKYGGASLTQELVASFYQRRHDDSQYVQRASHNGALYPNGNRSNSLLAATLSSENNSQVQTLLNGELTTSPINPHHQSSTHGTTYQATSASLNGNGQIQGENHIDDGLLQAFLRDYMKESSCPRQPLPQGNPNDHLLQNKTQPNAGPIREQQKEQQTHQHATGNPDKLAVPQGQNSSSNKPVSYPRKSMGKEAWVLEYLRQNSREQVDEPSNEQQTASPESSLQNSAALSTAEIADGIHTAPVTLTPVEIPADRRTLDVNSNNLDDSNNRRKANLLRESESANHENILNDIVRETLVATTPSPCQTQSIKRTDNDALQFTPNRTEDSRSSITTPCPDKTKARRSSKSRTSLGGKSSLTDNHGSSGKPIPSEGGKSYSSRTITPSPSKTQGRRSSQTKLKSTEDRSPHLDRQARLEKTSSKRGDEFPASKEENKFPSPKEGQKSAKKRRASLDTDGDGVFEIVNKKVGRTMSKDSGYSEATWMMSDTTVESGTRSEDSDMSGIETITIDDEDKSDVLDNERTQLNNLIRSRNYGGKWKNSWSDESMPQLFDCRVVLSPITMNDKKSESNGGSKETGGTGKPSVGILDERTGELIHKDSQQNRNDNGEKLETIPVPKKSPSTLEQEFLQNKHSSQNHSKESSHAISNHGIPSPKKSPTLDKECLPSRDSAQSKPLTGIVLKANTTHRPNKFYNMYNPCFLILNQLRQCLNLTERDNNTMNSCVLATARIINEMFVLKMEQNFNLDSPCFKRIVSDYAKTNKVNLILILSYYQDDVYRILHEHIENTDGYVIGKHEDVKACLLELIWLSRNIDLDAGQHGELVKYVNLYRKLGTL